MWKCSIKSLNMAKTITHRVSDQLNSSINQSKWRRAPESTGWCRVGFNVGPLNVNELKEPVEEPRSQPMLFWTQVRPPTLCSGLDGFPTPREASSLFSVTQTLLISQECPPMLWDTPNTRLNQRASERASGSFPDDGHKSHFLTPWSGWGGFPLHREAWSPFQCHSAANATLRDVLLIERQAWKQLSDQFNITIFTTEITILTNFRR